MEIEQLKARNAELKAENAELRSRWIKIVEIVAAKNLLRAKTPKHVEDLRK